MVLISTSCKINILFIVCKGIKKDQVLCIRCKIIIEIWIIDNDPGKPTVN